MDENEAFRGLSKEVQDVWLSAKKAVRNKSVCGQRCKDGSSCRRPAAPRTTSTGLAVETCSTHAEAARYTASLQKHCDTQISVERELFNKKLALVRAEYIETLRQANEACEERVKSLVSGYEALTKAQTKVTPRKSTRKTPKKTRRSKRK